MLFLNWFIAYSSFTEILSNGRYDYMTSPPFRKRSFYYISAKFRKMMLKVQNTYLSSVCCCFHGAAVFCWCLGSTSRVKLLWDVRISWSAAAAQVVCYSGPWCSGWILRSPWGCNCTSMLLATNFSSVFRVISMSFEGLHIWQKVVRCGTGYPGTELWPSWPLIEELALALTILKIHCFLCEDLMMEIPPWHCLNPEEAKKCSMVKSVHDVKKKRNVQRS